MRNLFLKLIGRIISPELAMELLSCSISKSHPIEESERANCPVCYHYVELSGLISKMKSGSLKCTAEHEALLSKKKLEKFFNSPISKFALAYLAAKLERVRKKAEIEYWIKNNMQVITYDRDCTKKGMSPDTDQKQL